MVQALVDLVQTLDALIVLLKLLTLPHIVDLSLIFGFSFFSLEVLIVALVQTLVDMVQTLDALVRVHVGLL